MRKHRHSFRAYFYGALSASVMLGVSTTPFVATPAAAQEDEEKRQSSSQTLSPAVAKVLQVVFEDLNAENYPAALSKLNDLISSRGAKMKPYDKAVTYQLRGQAYAATENYRAALRDFQTAVNSGGLPETNANGVRYVIAQLYFQLEDYNAAISSLQNWINGGGAPDANAYYLLAAAYTQITPPKFRSAISPAEQAIALREEPKKSDHDLLNLVYSELNMSTKRSALLEKMINLWPGNGSYWRQLSGLYNQQKKDKQAFAVLEVAYRAGLLGKQSEILTLVQYYSFFDNAYRGAKLLQKEMDAGNVKRTVKNLKLLSQLWSQSREHKRAIPVLEAAAKSSDDGELYYRLGQVLLADEQYVKAERALVRARNKGGLTAKQLGDTWMLSGTSRFSRAGPGDCELRTSARRAFENATRFETSARQARSWVQYIRAIDSTEEAQDRLAWQQANDERKATIDRTKQQLQVCRLQGGADDECTQIETSLAVLEEQDKAAKTAPSFGCKAAEDDGAKESGSSAKNSGEGTSTDAAPETPAGETTPQ